MLSGPDALVLPSAALVTESREILGRHGRSFRLAGMFLGAEELDDAALLYAFCRLADDTVDEADSPQLARAGALALREELRGKRMARPLVATFRRMALRRRIPIEAAHHLLDGMESDLDEVRIADDAALLRYCYNAAGTVGLMMCGVLGARTTSAWPYAIDLGIGMQLSNIARDVTEDARKGRVYLPLTRLEAHGVDPEALVRGDADPVAVSRVVAEILALAEGYYHSADAGVAQLPWRGRLTVLAAGRLYRAIGRLVLRRGVDALRSRSIVGAVEKIFHVAGALFASLHPLSLGWRRRPHDARLHAALAGLPGTNG